MNFNVGDKIVAKKSFYAMRGLLPSTINGGTKGTVTDIEPFADIYVIELEGGSTIRQSLQSMVENWDYQRADNVKSLDSSLDRWFKYVQPYIKKNGE